MSFVFIFFKFLLFLHCLLGKTVLPSLMSDDFDPLSIGIPPPPPMYNGPPPPPPPPLQYYPIPVPLPPAQTYSQMPAPPPPPPSKEETPPVAHIKQDEPSNNAPPHPLQYNQTKLAPTPTSYMYSLLQRHHIQSQQIASNAHNTPLDWPAWRRLMTKVQSNTTNTTT